MTSICTTWLVIELKAFLGNWGLILTPAPSVQQALWSEDLRGKESWLGAPSWALSLNFTYQPWERELEMGLGGKGGADFCLDTLLGHLNLPCSCSVLTFAKIFYYNFF